MSQSKYSKKTSQIDGFSNRFNSLLDGVPDMPPLEYGRALAIAERYRASKSSGRIWLREDRPPKSRTLNQICEDLLPYCPQFPDTTTLKMWLLFETLPGQTEDEINHLALSKIYIRVHEEAEKLGLELEDISEEKLENIYSILSIMNSRYRAPTPDPAIVERLLKLASSSE